MKYVISQKKVFLNRMREPADGYGFYHDAVTYAKRSRISSSQFSTIVGGHQKKKVIFCNCNVISNYLPLIRGDSLIWQSCL